jgi:hypothetical protein
MTHRQNAASHNDVAQTLEQLVIPQGQGGARSHDRLRFPLMAGFSDRVPGPRGPVAAVRIERCALGLDCSSARDLGNRIAISTLDRKQAR